MKDIQINQNGNCIGTIHLNQDGSCAISGQIGEYQFINVRDMLLHLTGFNINFGDLLF